MENVIINIINEFGYFGIMFLVAIENIFPPIPSELILSFGGFLTTYTKLSIIGVVIFSTIGSLIGAVVLYIFGKKLGNDYIYRLIDGKVGKILRLKKEDIDKTNNWFKKYGNKAVFFGRFVPLIRSLISIPAGSANMKLSIFLPLSFLGSLIWNFILVFLGSIAKETWQNISNAFSIYSAIFGLILLIVGIVCFSIFIVKRNNSKKE